MEDHLIPDLIIADREPLGKWGLLRKHYFTDCETFCFAFKLGAKIMMDVLTDGPMKEI